MLETVFHFLSWYGKFALINASLSRSPFRAAWRMAKMAVAFEDGVAWLNHQMRRRSLDFREPPVGLVLALQDVASPCACQVVEDVGSHQASPTTQLVLSCAWLYMEATKPEALFASAQVPERLWMNVHDTKVLYRLFGVHEAHHSIRIGLKGMEKNLSPHPNHKDSVDLRRLQVIAYDSGLAEFDANVWTRRYAIACGYTEIASHLSTTIESARPQHLEKVRADRWRRFPLGQQPFWFLEETDRAPRVGSRNLGLGGL